MCEKCDIMGLEQFERELIEQMKDISFGQALRILAGKLSEIADEIDENDKAIEAHKDDQNISDDLVKDIIQNRLHTFYKVHAAAGIAAVLEKEQIMKLVENFGPELMSVTGRMLAATHSAKTEGKKHSMHDLFKRNGS